MDPLVNEHQDFTTFNEIENRYNQTSCSICLEDFTSESYTTVTKCHHIFHSLCLNAWENSNSPKSNRCPLCSEVITRPNWLYVKLTQCSGVDICGAMTFGFMLVPVICRDLNYVFTQIIL
ncbi:MAG: RING-H2 finger protein [Waddliaceae bacterium]